MIRVLWRLSVLFFACCSSSSEDTQSTLLIPELISPIEITLGGEMTYKDSGDKGYGWHAIIIHTDSEGTEHRDILGHMERPDNSDELIQRGPTRVDAGDEIGSMGNTGGVWTSDGGTQDPAPVTPEQRDRGLGAHLHHDRSHVGVNPITGLPIRIFTDPRGENGD